MRKNVNDKKERQHGGLDFGARDLDYDFSKMNSKSSDIVENKKEVVVNDTIKNIESSKNRFNILEKKEEQSSDNIDKEVKMPDFSIKKEDSPKIINPPRVKEVAKAGGKIKMEDVKYVPKLMGPVDELREMDLVNFRRLSTDPRGAANKINDKIQFLESESYSQRLSGIKAWRQSPVNRMYLQAGTESMDGEGHIKDVLKSKNMNDSDFLNEEEVEAIMELNRKLRF